MVVVVGNLSNAENGISCERGGETYQERWLKMHLNAFRSQTFRPEKDLCILIKALDFQTQEFLNNF